MAVTYSAPNFSVDNAATNIAGLIAVKGGAIATTDNVYVYNNGVCDIEQSVSLNQLYINDNPAGSAVTKQGFITSTTGGITITLNDTTVRGGLFGKTGTGVGYYSLVGSVGNLITIVSNTAVKASTAYGFTLPNIFKYCRFTDFERVYGAHAGVQIENCDLLRPANAGFHLAVVPGSFLTNTITDHVAACTAILASATATKAELQTIFSNCGIVRTAAGATTDIQLVTTMPIGTSYVDYDVFSSATPTQIDRIDQIAQLLAAMLL